MIESNDQSITRARAASATRVPKDAFDWNAIPDALRTLAPDKEPVVRGSKLDDALKKMFLDNKKELSCSMLSNSKEPLCRARGKLAAKGYGGKVGCMKFQAKCACSKTFTWASRISEDKPSLAELVYKQELKRQTRKETHFQVMASRLKPKAVEAADDESITPDVTEKRKANVLESLFKETRNMSIAKQTRTNSATFEEFKKTADDPKSWANLDVDQVSDTGVSVDLDDDNHDVKDSMDNLQVIMNSSEESEVRKVGITSDSNQMKTELGSLSTVVSVCEISVENCMENQKPTTEKVKTFLGSELLSQEEIDSMLAGIKSSIDTSSGLVEINIVVKLIEIVTALTKEINLLKGNKESCGCANAAITSDTNSKGSKDKLSFAAVVKAADKRFTGEKWSKAVAEKVESIQQRFDMPDIKEAETFASSVLKLEGSPQRKKEELTSLYITGLRKIRYGELRKLFSDVGIKKNKILNMVWRGQTLQMIVPKKAVSNVAQCIAAASQKIKVHLSMKWNNWFQAESKGKTNVDIKKMLSFSNENLIASSYQYVKHAARQSANEAMSAFQLWCRTTASGKEDDSFQEVQKRHRIKKNAVKADIGTKVGLVIGASDDSPVKDAEEPKTQDVLQNPAHIEQEVLLIDDTSKGMEIVDTHPAESEKQYTPKYDHDIEMLPTTELAIIDTDIQDKSMEYAYKPLNNSNITTNQNTNNLQGSSPIRAVSQ